MDATSDNLRARLAADSRLLGPCAPLSAVYEEVLRDWRGLPTRGARMASLRALAEGADPTALLADDDAGVRLPAGALAALRRDRPPWPHGSPANAADPNWVAIAMAKLPTTPAAEYLARFPASIGAGPLTLLAFLTALHADALDGPGFAAYVMGAGVLMPEVGAHRPHRRLHGLLDYLGMSDEPHVQWRYRELALRLWSTASHETWADWRWIRAVGDPRAAARAATALDDTWALAPLHALRHFPAPGDDWPSGHDDAVCLVGVLLRGEAEHMPEAWGGPEAAQWLVSPPVQAWKALAEQPPWWRAWLKGGLPVARAAITHLQHVELPAGTNDRHAWLSAHLLPTYRAIVVNLLLSRAAAGEGRDDILALARGGDSDAVRALAHWPKADEALIGDLLALRDRPAQARNAADALAMLARRVGLPDVAELERRHLWATAWRREVLGHDRVRTDWPCDPYQLRLSVTRDGTARLEALGPEGPLVRPPADLRATDAYREARAVQREVEAQLRRFRAFLERAMVEQCPIAVDEWRYLLANPAFAWLAERLVWHSGGGDTFLWTAPERWECLGGMAMPVEALPGHMSLVVAHPAALAPDVLVGWQAIAAARPLKQPFRQLFREVYLPHIGDGPMCGRFVGRQVAPSAAYALLRTTGFAPGSGEATRAWPGGVTAHFRWAVDVTGRELFGRHARAAVNTGGIWFTRGGLTLTAGEVDGVLYSETLRVADLVTARARVGEGDLTSAETLAVRAAILREVACALGCTGILAPEGERHAVILGTRATYRLSLANGAVFLEPEGRQMVLPHASSDEDEDGTAAIIATALLLADDASITDPYFLGQLPADQSVAGSTKV